jgi:hypothetical protein
LTVKEAPFFISTPPPAKSSFSIKKKCFAFILINNR